MHLAADDVLNRCLVMVAMVAMMIVMMTMLYIIIKHNITYYIIICLRRACMKAESDSMAHFTSSSALAPPECRVWV